MDIKEIKDSYLLSLGHCHKESFTETYKCKPYKPENVRYSKPLPDPNGEAEYTYTQEKDVADDITDNAFNTLVAINTQKAVETLIQKKEQDAKTTEKLDSMDQSITVIKKIMIGFAVLTAINVISALVICSKIASIASVFSSLLA